MSFLSAKKQVLLIGNDGILLYVVSGKRATLYGDYSNAGGSLTTELRKAFRAINAPLTLLFDVVEQQYRKEPIPKVSFFDKSKVIQRKLLMAFPQQQMRAALPVKQTPKAGESVVALFAGLSPSLTTTQVMDAVISSEIAIDGAVLLPVESTSLVVKLAHAAHKRAKTPDDTRWSVLMTHHKTGGLRQTIVKDGELALTRLTPLAVDPHNASALAEEMAREFNASLTYLSRFGYVPSDGLDLIVVSSDQVAQAIRNYRLPVSHLYPMTNYEAGQLVGITPVVPPDDVMYGDALHAAWVGSQRRLAMPLTAPLFDKVRQSRQSARAAIFLLFFGACYLGWQCFNVQTEIVGIQNEIQDLKVRKIAMQNQFDAESKRLNTLKFDPEDVAEMLKVYDEFDSQDVGIEPSLVAINNVIQKDKIFLRKIAFAPGAGGTGMEGAMASAQAAVNGQAAMENKPDKPDVTITLTVTFPETMPVEEAARLTNDLSDRLTLAFPGHAITIDDMVGNLSIDRTVQGVSEQISAQEVDGRLVKRDEASKLSIKGDLL